MIIPKWEGKNVLYKVVITLLTYPAYYIIYTIQVTIKSKESSQYIIFVLLTAENIDKTCTSAIRTNAGVWVVRSLRWHWNGKEGCSLSNCAFVSIKYRGGELKPFKRIKIFTKRVFHTIPYLNTLDSYCSCGRSYKKYKHDFKNNIFVHIRSGFCVFSTFVISHEQPQCLFYRCINIFNLKPQQRYCLI